jgi:arylsulfatase A-like enzyme
LSLFALLSSALAASADPSTTLLIGIDGLRPDYITPEVMPNLHALGQAGMFFEHHHAVYPTVTRVNVTSIATGVYPGKHGLMDNTIYVPEVDAERVLSTADYAKLQAVDEATGGKLIQVPSMGEILDAAGKKLLVISSGSTGSAFLLNHKAKGLGIIHPEYALPAALHERVQAVLGPAPAEAYPNTGWIDRTVDAYLRLAVEELHPDVTFMWLTDPDHTAHTKGMGDPVTLDALRGVDNAIGRLLAGLEERNLRGATNILVTSDHGFATHGGTANPFLVSNQILRELRGDPRKMIIAGFGLYLLGENKALLPAFAARLQAEPWVGALFTRDVDAASVPGAFAYNTIHYDNDRAPDLLLSPDWNDDKNALGIPGTTMMIGVAGHGSASPWEIHNTLIVSGPAFRAQSRGTGATCNVDLAPTILRLHDLAVPAHMDGRVIEEALLTGPEPATMTTSQTRLEASTTLPDGSAYQLQLNQSETAGKTYLDGTRTIRTPAAAPAAAE